MSESAMIRIRLHTTISKERERERERGVHCPESTSYRTCAAEQERPPSSQR
jgi:hypothetical protein